MTAPLFRSLDSAAIAVDIRAAQHSICYAAPGIQDEPAKAMAEVAKKLGPELITVCLDFDERVMRMGFGDLAAVKSSARCRHRGELNAWPAHRSRNRRSSGIHLHAHGALSGSGGSPGQRAQRNAAF